MTKPLFACDIDHTLIYSHRHPHPDWLCVEWINGQEQAYISPKTLSLLSEVLARTRLVLVTTRSIAQYRRLKLPGTIDLALTANGADLLVAGVPDLSWRGETDALMKPWRRELERCVDILANAPEGVRWRLVDETYLLVRCAAGDDLNALAMTLASQTTLDVRVSAGKLYLLPPPLDKGQALDRLSARLGCDWRLAAGDSSLDVPMLVRADLAIAPECLRDSLPGTTRLCPSNRLFSEFVMEQALACTSEAVNR